MVRQVDLKALVSHVVRGDGINKCRICMGDTTEGQVHLNDTVMMDGDKAITLTELLEATTGIQVQTDGELPMGVCSDCVNCALSAAEFKSFCRNSTNQWELMLQLLHDLPAQYEERNKTIFAILNSSEMIIINDKAFLSNRESAAVRLTTHLMKPNEIYKSPPNLKCHDCGKKFQYAHGLHNHLKESPDLKRACIICGKIMTRDDLVKHMIIKHRKEPYDCKKCPAMLFSFKHLKQHLIKEHSNSPTECFECGRTFRTVNAFHAHVAIHRSRNCPSCNKIFRNQTCYIHHVKHCCNLYKSRFNMNHEKTKMRVEVKNSISKRKAKVGLRGAVYSECICDYCGKKFTGKKCVAAHIQIVHTKDTHKPCKHCGKSFAAARMSEHVRKHRPSLSFKCEHCNMILKTKLGFTQHLRLHTGERPYACEFCGEKFSSSSGRSEHVRKMHKKSEIVLKHSCEVCPAKFRLPYRLKKHMISVHNKSEDETKQFECDECHERFSSCRGLLHHSRKHQQVSFPPKKPEKSVMIQIYSEEIDKSS